MARYRIHHKTTYHYQYPVGTSHHTARLKPLDNAFQKRESHSLSITPDATELVERQDYFGNAIQLFSIEETHDALEVDSLSMVDVEATSLNLQSLDTQYDALASALADIKRTDFLEAKQYLYPTDFTPAMKEAKDFGSRFFCGQKPIGIAIQEMLDAFATEFEFDPQATDISTPIGEVFQHKRGVCQDFAHLMIASLRACGLSARYVSGYILTHPKEGEERLAGADASHAWVSVFTPGNGWIEVDPTNRLVCADQHVRVAYGRDFSDAGMLSGAITGGGQHSIDVEVTMSPVE